MVELLDNMATQVSYALDNFSRENRRRRYEQELARSEALYRGIVETAGEGIAILDLNDRIILLNERLAQLMVISQDAAINHSIYSVLKPEQAREAKAVLGQCKTGKPIASYECQFHRPDGSTLNALVSIKPQ